MKVFSKRPGVELLTVCGEYLLAATGEARGACPYISQISASAAEFWSAMEGTMSAPELADRVARSRGKSGKDLVVQSILFVSKMAKSGYLLEGERS